MQRCSAVNDYFVHCPALTACRTLTLPSPATKRARGRFTLTSASPRLFRKTAGEEQAGEREIRLNVSTMFAIMSGKWTNKMCQSTADFSAVPSEAAELEFAPSEQDRASIPSQYNF